MPQFNTLCEYLVDFNNESIPIALRGQLVVNNRFHTFRNSRLVEGLLLYFKYDIEDWHVLHKVWQFDDDGKLNYQSSITEGISDEICVYPIDFSTRHFEFHYESLRDADLPDDLRTRTINLIGRVLYDKLLKS
ncbi:MAG: hypothetical protein Q8Q01_05630 [archaeon]|nr:hypothetical protein [archaeon]